MEKKISSIFLYKRSTKFTYVIIPSNLNIRLLLRMTYIHMKLHKLVYVIWF